MQFPRKSFRSLVRTAATAVCAGALTLSSFASHAAPELGVYRWDASAGPANVDGFSQWLGKPVNFATAFEASDSWDNIDGAAWQLQPWSQWVRAQAGRNLSLAVPLVPWGATLDACSTGQYDTYWTNLANELASYGLSWAYLRLGWEPDGGWYAWGAPQGSGKEASYAGCFRRVVQVMRQAQPANQWKFVWNVTTAWWDPAYLPSIWPGDSYVDVVGIDLYDQSWVAGTYPYPAGCDANCQLSSQQTAWNDYSWKLNQVRAFAASHGKPMGIPEWGVAIRPDGHGGGDNAFFIQKMADFVLDPANNVLFHSYFNVSAGDIDARLTDAVTGDNPGGATRFPKAAAAYKQRFGGTATTTPANTAPTVSVTSPSAGQTVAGTIAYAANATDNAAVTRVDFFIDATSILSVTSAPYGGSLDTTRLANGTHTLKAVAYDAQGLSAASQVSINVQNVVAVPTPTPTTTTATPAPGTGSLNVWFKAPTNGKTVSGVLNAGPNCYVNGTGVAKVQFFLDSSALNWDTAMADGMQCQLDTTKFANGSHTLTAVAYSSTGTTRKDVISINIQNSATTPPANTAPTVSLTSPSANQYVSGTVSYAASATDNAGVSRVDFSLDGAALLSDTASPYGGSLDTTKLANGAHVLKATAYDGAGLSSSSQVTFNVQNVVAAPSATATPAPTAGALDVWFKAPLAGSTVSGLLDAGTSCYVKGTGVVKVAFYLDATALNTDTTMADGMQCRIDTTRFGNGSHQLKAVAYDASGATRSDVITINVQNPSPM